MEKITQVRIYNSDLKDFLISKSYINEKESIAQINITENKDGIIVLIEDLTLGEKQKKFMNMLVKNMDISVRLILIIKSSAYGLSTVAESNVFEKLKGSDLFHLRKEKDWLKINTCGKKAIEEINQLFEQYDLPPLEK